jgi:hypothetical protein
MYYCDNRRDKAERGFKDNRGKLLQIFFNQDMASNCEKDMKKQVLSKSIESTMNSLSGFLQC